MVGVLHQVDHKYKISFFFFLACNRFLRDIDLAFLIPTLSLFHSFIQGKNVPLKDFVLVGTGLITEADNDLSKYIVGTPPLPPLIKGGVGTSIN